MLQQDNCGTVFLVQFEATQFHLISKAMGILAKTTCPEYLAELDAA